MTANQLAFQRNAIESAAQVETMRKNREAERLKAQELAQSLWEAENKLGVQNAQLAQQERENAAKYGYTTYMSPNEDRGGSREVFNLVKEGFEWVLNPLLKIFGGKK